jgi:hypothetical protein
MRALFLPCFLGVAMALALHGCTTKFPVHPPEHALLQALEAWPEEYYWLLETGVSSRVLGLRQPGDSLPQALSRVEQTLEAVRAQWDTLAALNSAVAIMDHLKANALEPVAGAIQQTLEANQAREPDRHMHEFLQAYAIKQGLVDAYRKFKQQRG